MDCFYRHDMFLNNISFAIKNKLAIINNITIKIRNI